MNKILKTLRKHWTRVWLIAVLLMSGGIYVTYAVYTEVSSVKRVVSTQAAPVEMFSSNCMRPDISSRRLSSAEYSVTVCNFDQDKPTIYNPSTISYTLHAELQVKQGDDYKNINDLLTSLDSEKSALEAKKNELDQAASDYEEKRSELQAKIDDTVTKYTDYSNKSEQYSIYKSVDDTNGMVTEQAKYFTVDNHFSVAFVADSLAPHQSSVDKYKVMIDPASINAKNIDIYVHVWAVPTEPGNLSTIETRLYGAAAVTDTASWTGKFLEEDCDTVDYDFYNYMITGSGAGTVDILWDPSKFSINDFFFNTPLSNNIFVGGNTPTDIEISDAQYGGEKYDGKYVGWKKITLRVDSGNNSKNRYELQLYKTEADSLTGVSYTGDNAATNYIACYFNH